MTISYEQKNTNILNRFEAREGSGRCKAYRLKLNDGNAMTLISMQGESYDELIASQKAKWGKRFESLSDV